MVTLSWSEAAVAETYFAAVAVEVAGIWRKEESGGKSTRLCTHAHSTPAGNNF